MSNIAIMFSFSVLSFILGMILIPKYIKILSKFEIGQKIRKNAAIGKALKFYKLHEKKEGTPTMGGLIILILLLFMVIVSVFLQKLGFINHSLFNRNETYLSLFTLISVGMVGMIDDIMNIKNIGKKGMSIKFKFIWIIILASLGSIWFYYKLGWENYSLDLLFLGQYNIGIWFIPLYILLFISITNSVNITDGLDGLAGGLLLMCYSTYVFITYNQGMFLLSTLCITIVGVLISFLWFNVKPAQCYMGDVGSLALGANLGVMAMLTNTMLIFLIISFLFICNTISVILQLSSKKLRNNKKIFHIAPFHHHLEAIGRNEETIVFRFWILQIVLTIIAITVYIL